MQISAFTLIALQVMEALKLMSVQKNQQIKKVIHLLNKKDQHHSHLLFKLMLQWHQSLMKTLNMIFKLMILLIVSDQLLKNGQQHGNHQEKNLKMLRMIQMVLQLLLRPYRKRRKPQ